MKGKKNAVLGSLAAVVAVTTSTAIADIENPVMRAGFGLGALVVVYVLGVFTERAAS